jgi:radical SAM superfamily enzyme YgiQ (UPF0313 family)
MKLDALLVHLSINPYFDMLSSYSIGQLGQYYLAEYADKYGYNVKVKFYNSFDVVSDLLPELIAKTSCRILGFYVDSETVWTLRILVPLLHKRCPNLYIVLGGPQVTGDPYGTLQLVPNVICGIIGEGEVPFLKLIQSEILNEEVLKEINGLIYYDSSRKLMVTKPQKPNPNIDEYGYPKREKYCLDKDKVTFPQLITGRGCMGHCAFCYEGGQVHTKLRVRSIESCLEEIDYLVQTYHIKYINLVDDTFILNRNRTEEFCNRMIEKYNGKIKWYCEARADILSKNIDILPLLKQAGLVKIQLGGESGCQEILNAYKKGVTIEEIEFVTEKIAEAGIPYIYVNFIIGGAFETESTFNRTLAFAKKLMHIAPGRVEVSSSVFTPTPGSPMYNNPEDFGLKIIDKRTIRGASCSFVFAETEQLNQYKIWQLRNKFNNEINIEYTSLIDSIPTEQIKDIFYLYTTYSIETPWSSLLKTKGNYRNYFEPIARGGFYEFKSLNHDEILQAIPYRTTHLSSDGVAFYRVSKSGENIKNSDLENALITLSAGKLSFQDIISIVKSSNILTDKQDVERECMSVYQRFEEDLSVIWRKV